MKTKLLLVLILIPFLAISQTINNFNGTDGAIYAVVSSSDSGFDPGANPTGGAWNFTFTSSTTSSDAYSTPTGAEIIEYPGSTSLQTTTIVTGISSSETVKTFTKNNSGEISVTGLESSDLGLSLNYNVDNALVGTFPYSSTSVTSDLVAGMGDFNGTSVDFDGDVEVNIDNTGDLVMTVDGNQTYSGTVTRLRIFQEINISINPGFGSIQVGQANQTSYFYYDNTTNDLVFRSTYTYINITLVAPQTIEETVMESIMSSSTLGTNENQLKENKFVVYPNPVNDNLKFEVDANVQAISIIDITGKIVLNNKTTEKELSINQLKSGVYFILINTDKGIQSKRFIKE